VVKTYNCQAAKCLSAAAEEDMMRLFMDCHMQNDATQKDACMENLQEVAETGENLEEELAADGKKLESAAKKGAMAAGIVPPQV
jgi:hypothetical protein